MEFKIGKIIEYDKNSGKIISIEETYFFLETDIIGKIENGDIVKFKDEKRKDKRVFFVEKIKEKV